MIRNVKNFLHLREARTVKKILGMLGFGKADEMEKSIQLNSMRWAWGYSLAFLFVWSVYELHVNGAGTPLPFILLFSQGSVAALSGHIYRIRMGKGEDEGKEAPEEKPTTLLAKLKRINDMATPEVVSVVMIIVAVITTIRLLMTWW